MPERRANGRRDDSGETIAINRKAFHRYEVLDKIECGIALCGSEVKSLRAKNVAFADSYAVVRHGELFLLGLNIAEYRMANRANHPLSRPRKLLAHRREISRLAARVAQQGLTLVPLDLHWRRGRAKVTLALVRGKREFDKRAAIRQRDDERQRQRLLRRRA
ncbi:MAG: SsrA-binding protein SmpB [Planctomycetota bacterium]|nr:SsrA-binding protein SmpB [Planctomycetota bacterium]